MKTLPCLLLCLVVLLSGCARHFVQVDAFALDDAVSMTGKSFTLAPLDAAISPEDLEFREFARYIEQALTAQGMVYAPQGEPDDLRVLFSYGVSEPLTTQSEATRPVYGRVGYAPRFYSYKEPQTNRVVTRAVYEPRYGLVGYQTEVYTKTEYISEIDLQVFEAGTGQDSAFGRQLWKIRGQYRGKNGDLRFLFPRMIQAMTPHFGTNSRQILEVELPDS